MGEELRDERWRVNRNEGMQLTYKGVTQKLLSQLHEKLSTNLGRPLQYAEAWISVETTCDLWHGYRYDHKIPMDPDLDQDPVSQI